MVTLRAECLMIHEATLSLHGYDLFPIDPRARWIRIAVSANAEAASTFSIRGRDSNPDRLCAELSGTETRPTTLSIPELIEKLRRPRPNRRQYIPV